MSDDAFLKLANALNDSYRREIEWLKAANELQRKQLLEQDLEIARLHGRNQGLEMVARAVDSYPLGEYPPLTALSPRPPSG